MRKTALSIAGSDCSGGAGIQADIKTMMANGVYAMSAITAMTAQNTTGVTAIQESSPEFLTQQLDCVFTDIFPDAVKVGMVSSAALIRVIADRLDFYRAKNIVIDPVMVSTSGSALLDSAALDALKCCLFPLADLLTPNIPEAEVLTGRRISAAEQMQAAAVSLGETYGCSVLVKGGHSLQDADDVLYSRFRDGCIQWFHGTRIDNPNTHGTGCTLSSAIAANLAKGDEMETAIRRAKDYLGGALRAGLDLGAGSGPVDHGYRLF